MSSPKTSSSQYTNRQQVLAVCPILVCSDLIAGRWTTHVIWALRDKPLAFGAVRRSIPFATERMIARRLVELSYNGVVECDGIGRSKRYCLSLLGKRLIPLLQTMFDLGQVVKRNPAWVPAASLNASL